MMNEVRKSLKGLVLVAVVGLSTVSAGAQQAGAPTFTAARSYALQSQLQAIDQDRAGFVYQLLTQWAPYIDNNVYDLQAELGAKAMTVPAWQLYGASLAGDFRTMVRVLGGMEGAGPYINALTEPQPKTAMDTLAPGPAVLGDLLTDLVFVPIAPCRMVDTRLTGARTGILTAGTSRTFDLTTDGFTKGQGSAVSCVGLPSFSNYAWAINVAVTQSSGNGWLTGWASGGTEPTASIINYASAPYALNNGQILIGCWGCLDDIQIKAYSASTHVIIDVTGYFREATVAASTVTRIAGTVTPIANGTAAFVTGGACPAGTVLVGGEVDHGSSDLAVGASHQLSSTTWIFWMINNSGGAGNVTAYSRCMDTPVRLF